MQYFSARYFFRNLAAYLLGVPCLPIYLLIDLYMLTKDLILGYDGSRLIAFPWEYFSKEYFQELYRFDDTFKDF